MEYRELNIRPLFGPGFSRFDSHANDLKGEMVESAPKVVDNIASDSGDVRAVDVEWSTLEGWLRGLRLSLHADRLEGCFTEGRRQRDCAARLSADLRPHGAGHQSCAFGSRPT